MSINIEACIKLGNLRPGSREYDYYLVKYPFTKDAKNRIKNLGLNELLKNEEIIRRGFEIIKEALIDGKISDNFDNTYRELLAHYVAIMIMSKLPEKTWFKFANIEAKRLSNYLECEVRECVLYIAYQLGIDFKPLHDITNSDILLEVFDIAVPVWSYLKYMPKNDPNWKLINRYVIQGYVLLDIKEFIRYVEEYVKKMIMSMIRNARENEYLIESIVKILDREFERIYWELEVKYRSATSKHVITGTYPPCIEAIINDIKSGGNPSHMARFTVAAFLLRVKIDYEKKPVEEVVEEIVDLFRTVADFNEKITRYQVEHIAGLKGGRKFYMPPNCDELNSLGLCPNNMACSVKNPLIAYIKSIKVREKIEKKVKS